MLVRPETWCLRGMTIHVSAVFHAHHSSHCGNPCKKRRELRRQVMTLKLGLGQNSWKPWGTPSRSGMDERQQTWDIWFYWKTIAQGHQNISWSHTILPSSFNNFRLSTKCLISCTFKNCLLGYQRQRITPSAGIFWLETPLASDLCWKLVKICGEPQQIASESLVQFAQPRGFNSPVTLTTALAL